MRQRFFRRLSRLAFGIGHLIMGMAYPWQRLGLWASNRSKGLR